MTSIDGEAAEAGARPSALARFRWPLMIGGPLVVLAVVAWFIITGGRTESTDDAYVQGAMAPISAAIAGRVVEVDVKENQRVTAGQVLFRLDPSDEQAAESKAAASLAAAKLQVTVLRATYDTRKLQLSQALKTETYALREAARQKALVSAGVASQQDASMAAHNADLAVSQVAVARQAVATALADLGAGNKSPDQYPGVLQAKAAQQSTQVTLGDTTVYARQAGIVTRVDQLQVGAHVGPSQTLFFLISGEPWVEANFKEDQLTYMRVGQPAEIKVDALGGRVLKGHVASFSPGSGSAFSALPAQNATGNWVKVAQRLPVRIAFNKPPPEVAGRVGLSTTVTVDVLSGRPK